MARIWICVFIGFVAVVEDILQRRISNWIPFVASVAGLSLQLLEHGWRGLLAWFLGTLTGGAVFLIFYLLGGMGGGDIKLMAGFGAILGPRGVFEAALWTAACGGLFAVVVITAKSLRRAFNSRDPEDAGGLQRPERDSIPYAPAIAAGVWLSLLGRV